MYYVPVEGELFPEWRVMFAIAFPGEDNFYRIEITPSDIPRIKSSEKWIEIDHHTFNKDLCESFRFETEVKDIHGSWHPYSKERVDEILKSELEQELVKQLPDAGVALSSLLMGMDTVALRPSLEDEIKRIMTDKNLKKTGRGGL